MATPPKINEEFIREVDDELRRDQAIGIWQRYGRWIIAAIVVALALLAGFLWWQNDRATKLGVEGETLSAALDDVAAGKGAIVAPTLDTLAKSKASGIAVAAKFTEANLAIGKGDTRAAAATLGAIASDTSLDQPYRDLALIRQTAAEFDIMKPADVVARLKPLAAPGNPWFGSAGEMVAISYLTMGKPELAAALFAAIAKDNGAPASIRTRAAQIAGTLGVDTTPAKGSQP